MDIQTKHLGIGTLHVTAHGRLDLDNAVEYGTTIKEILEDTPEINELILDFMYINFISSFGLKVVLELYKYMQDHGSIKLTNVPDHIIKSFQMVGFDKFLEIQ